MLYDVVFYSMIIIDNIYVCAAAPYPSKLWIFFSS